MSSGALLAAYAYEVSPHQSAPFVGGAIPITPPLQSALDTNFERSRISEAPAVTFRVDVASPTRRHEVRDRALAIAFGTSPQEAAVEELAGRLANAMDNRSKPSLLMVSVHQGTTPTVRRLLIWAFPQQEVFNLTTKAGRPALELLDAFNRESKLRKAALLEGAHDRTGMLSARVLDFQSTASERAVADFWTLHFLDAQMQMSDLEGTQALARALRHAYTQLKGDDDSQEELGTAISTLRRRSSERWSLERVARELLGTEASRYFLEATRPEEVSALFLVDRDKFDHLTQYRRFALANGVVVSVPFAEMESIDGVTVTHVGDVRRLKLDAVIEEEQVRTRA